MPVNKGGVGRILAFQKNRGAISGAEKIWISGCSCCIFTYGLHWLSSLCLWLALTLQVNKVWLLQPIWWKNIFTGFYSCFVLWHIDTTESRAGRPVWNTYAWLRITQVLSTELFLLFTRPQCKTPQKPTSGQRISIAWQGKFRWPEVGFMLLLGDVSLL